MRKDCYYDVWFPRAFEPVEHTMSCFRHTPLYLVHRYMYITFIYLFIFVARIVFNVWQYLARGLNFVRPWYCSWWTVACYWLQSAYKVNLIFVPMPRTRPVIVHSSLLLYVVWCGCLYERSLPALSCSSFFLSCYTSCKQKDSVFFIPQFAGWRTAFGQTATCQSLDIQKDKFIVISIRQVLLSRLRVPSRSIYVSD
jgi:hypothetical protein